MVADANDLRETLGMAPIGQGLNAKLYDLFKTSPSLNFTDITQGNNTAHSTYKGFDLATGMGVPNANNLIPALADTVGSLSTNATFHGRVVQPLTSAVAGNAVTVLSGKGIATIGTQFLTLNLPLTSPFSTTTTATMTFPSISRGLDGTVSGEGTATVNTTIINPVTGMPVQVAVNFDIVIQGKVTGGRNRTKLKAQIFSIDPNTGARAQQGTLPIFEGTIN
jgi:hypothetical protein